MYYTHYFANNESLLRARNWLSRLGFGPESMETHTHGIPRLSVAVDWGRWSVVEKLINAVERSDPRGWPGLWEVTHQAHVYPAPPKSEGMAVPSRTNTTAIGWHPNDRLDSSDEDSGTTDYVTGLNRRWS
ncbi:hypothetical protein SAMN05444166_3219 [Singulisphaera sp. GP187]|uniref:hypothetical protein n=1 Tax=Singulisphaera sp. GP187 TaxID=1882752 RepID=UPI0009282A29|nr:hypothetical protein [Singulisphaera sp. GP187]SIO24580.1 hypothetical protein SAMN05444166_3219 [Singulisphaera sp. GP187]